MDHTLDMQLNDDEGGIRVILLLSVVVHPLQLNN